MIFLNVVDATTKLLVGKIMTDGVAYGAGYKVCKKSGMSEATSHKCGTAAVIVTEIANNMYSVDDKVIGGVKKGTNAVIQYVKNEIQRISEAGKKATSMMNGQRR